MGGMQNGHSPVNADVLEDGGYRFEPLDNDGLCTVTSDFYSRGTQPLNKFKINNTDKTVTIHTMLNTLEEEHHGQLADSAIMAAVCRKYNLEPDNVSSVVFNTPKDSCLHLALNSYRWNHRSQIGEDGLIDAVITPISNDWDLFSWCFPYAAIDRMLDRSVINQIRIQEGTDSCLLTYSINPGRQNEGEAPEQNEEEPPQ
ncbi:hypothetical protein CFIMG_007794RA00001 [Ceratocystis fimbriata CBS 114723]|uniref:Uncharacterized protein n=1 Tax=Ceratocystis fimbriata CBS 114723 TaxID=1035309 RepID=A0A2C5WU83_9PEZI|nr:hypothetical protein CFIMG_007794RA00001 [Ceratocystis fimbriata CBS 114723]